MRHGTAQPVVTRDFTQFADALTQNSRRLRSLFYDAFSVWGVGTAWLDRWPLQKRRDILKSVQFDDVMPGLVKFTVKRECGFGQPDKARGIQAYPNLATQEFYARTTYALQKAFGGWLGWRQTVLSGVRVTFASGLGSEDLGRWMADVLAEGPVVFYERDGKRWDSTMGRLTHDLKMCAYRACGVPDGYLAFVEGGFAVRGQHVSEQGVLRYRLVGTTKSGHNDTTLGNSIINAAIASEACFALGLNADVLVCGDDLLVAVRGDFDANALAAYESGFGIIPSYRKFLSYRHVSFISGAWFADGMSGFVFTPKPGRLLAKLFWTVNPPRGSRSDYLGGVVAGLRAVVGLMPVLRVFLHIHCPIGDYRAIGKAHLIYRNAPQVAVSMDEFCARYGVSVDAVLDFESHLLSLEGHVGLVSHGLIDAINAVDLVDVEDRMTH